MVVGELDRVFAALADGTRRDIVARVLQQEASGRRSRGTTLARDYAMSLAAVQEHVAVLEEAGLVREVRRGREQLVHGDVGTVRAAARLPGRFEDLWRARSGASTRSSPELPRRTTMPVVSASRDTGDLSLTIVAELAAPPARVWQVWVDPRRLERWWGPPGWPATSVRHDVVVGGTSRCSMTGPEGEEAHGWWRVVAVDEPRSLEFEDCFGEDMVQVRGMGMEEGMVQAMGQLDELLLTRV